MRLVDLDAVLDTLRQHMNDEGSINSEAMLSVRALATPPGPDILEPDGTLTKDVWPGAGEPIYHGEYYHSDLDIAYEAYWHGKYLVPKDFQTAQCRRETSEQHWRHRIFAEGFLAAKERYG